MPKIVDADERRERIAGVTWRLIAEVGFEATTMRRIAERAGSTTGLVTHYFANRDEVLLAAVRHVARASRQRHVIDPSVEPGFPTLRAFVMATLPHDKEHLLHWRIWIALWSQAGVNATLASEWKKRARQWESLLRQNLESALERGDLDPDLDLDEEGHRLSALLWGLCLNASLRNKVDPTDAAIVDGYLNRLTVPVSNSRLEAG